MSGVGDERAQVLEFLRQLGATEQQLVNAAESKLPAREALDVVLQRPFVLTLADVSERLGEPMERILHAIHAMGLRIDDPNAPAFAEDDVELLRVAMDIGTDLAYVLASALSRFADAGVATYIHDVEPRLSDPHADADQLEQARAEAVAGEIALRVSRGLGSMFIHMLREAVAWQRLAQEGVSETSLTRVAVGFVDLVGFTSMSRRMTAAQLGELVTAFESTTFDLAVHHGGRIVKHVGDEVMFVTLDAATGVRLAGDIIEAFSNRGSHPRGGVVHGELLAIRGDYYGSVVNLASRLTDESIPGEVLVDEPTAAAAAGSGVCFEPAGRRQLRGFDEPINTCSYVPHDTGAIGTRPKT